jgi:hypothetical protein
VIVKKQRRLNRASVDTHGSLSPRPSLKKSILVGFPLPPYDGLVSSVGIGSAGGGWWRVISKHQIPTGTQIRLNAMRLNNIIFRLKRSTFNIRSTPVGTTLNPDGTDESSDYKHNSTSLE